MLIKYRGTYPKRKCKVCERVRKQDYYAGAGAEVCGECLDDVVEVVVEILTDTQLTNHADYGKV